ncbi:hypothetical protein HK101_004076, partial [Irineochytrium annulatum]
MGPDDIFPPMASLSVISGPSEPTAIEAASAIDVRPNFCILLPDLEATYLKDMYTSRGIPVPLANDDGFLRSFCMGGYPPEGSVPFPAGAVTSAHVSTEQKMNGVTYIKMVGTLDCGRLGNLDCGCEPCHYPGSWRETDTQSPPGFSTDDVKVKVDLPSPSGSLAGACDMQFVATTAAGDPTSSSSGSTSGTSSSVALPVSMSLVAVFLAVALVALMIRTRQSRTAVPAVRARRRQESFYIVTDPLGSVRLKATPADASVAGETISSNLAGDAGGVVVVAKQDSAKAEQETIGRFWTTITEPPVAVSSCRGKVKALELDLTRVAKTKPNLVVDSGSMVCKKASK